MFGRSESNRSLFHHDHPHRHHHGGPFLCGVAISRLRPALYYFMFAVVITTFLYCLLFYEPDSARHHPHRRFRGHYPSSKLSLISSSSTGASSDDAGSIGNHYSAAFLLDEFIRNANVHFSEYYQTKTFLVPDEFESADSLRDFARQKSQRNLLENVHNETEHTNHEPDDATSQEEEVLDAEDEDYLELVDEPDSIEHYLEQLGFNIRHITRYLLHNNQSINATLNNLTKSTKPVTASKHSTPSSSKIVQPQFNLSSVSDILDFYNGIQDSQAENKLVVFVTAITTNQYSMAYRFVKSFERYHQTMAKQSGPKLHLRMMIYDLGLSEDQLFEIESLCNTTWEQSTTSLCKMRKFHFDHYPSHVSDLKIGAYRSIILQEMLRDIRQASIRRQQARSPSEQTLPPSRVFNLFWLDPHYRFLSGTARQHPTLLSQLLTNTRNISGISSWPIEAPTSSLTHPRMCEYFHTTADNFYFHRMVRSSHLALSIEEAAWQSFEYGIMLPWVKCALTQDCIAPLGSQWRSSCPLDKKPHYRYSGCHHYDMSAFNVVLGIAFNFASSEYSATPSDQFFAPFYKLLPSTKTTTTPTPALAASVTTTKPLEDDFDYADYDPGAVKHHVDESSLLESEERYDRARTDDDLPDDQRRPVPQRSLSGSASSSSLNLISPKLLRFHQPKPASALSPVKSASLLKASTSPEEALKQKRGFV